MYGLEKFLRKLDKSRFVIEKTNSLKYILTCLMKWYSPDCDMKLPLVYHVLCFPSQNDYVMKKCKYYDQESPINTIISKQKFC